jgi:hypothetical protein
MVENTNLLISKKDEWLDSCFGCCIPEEKAAVSL